jgi:glutamyl/glutaminyl-tRNA synthetase
MVLGPDHSKLSKRHGATSVSEFREKGYLPEALANYLALLGWSPGEGEELLPLEALAKRFRIEDVGKSAGVFDPDKLAWANRHYMKLASPERVAQLAVPFLEQHGWAPQPTEPALAFLAQAVPAAAASVDRLDQVPARLHFLFEYSAARALADPVVRAEALGARDVLAALAEELATSGPLVDRETFRSVATRVRERTHSKGPALFHPIRLAVTGEPQGLELDTAIPLIERGAILTAGERAGIGRIQNAGERVKAFLHELENPGRDA